jgi:hypothetical protein
LEFFSGPDTVSTLLMVMTNSATMFAKERHFFILNETPLLSLTFNIETNHTLQAAVHINHHTNTNIVPLIK